MRHLQIQAVGLAVCILSVAADPEKIDLTEATRTGDAVVTQAPKSNEMAATANTEMLEGSKVTEEKRAGVATQREALSGKYSEVADATKNLHTTSAATGMFVWEERTGFEFPRMKGLNEASDITKAMIAGESLGPSTNANGPASPTLTNVGTPESQRPTVPTPTAPKQPDPRAVECFAVFKKAQHFCSGTTMVGSGGLEARQLAPSQHILAGLYLKLTDDEREKVEVLGAGGFVCSADANTKALTNDPALAHRVYEDCMNHKPLPTLVATTCDGYKMAQDLVARAQLTDGELATERERQFENVKMCFIHSHSGKYSGELGKLSASNDEVRTAMDAGYIPPKYTSASFVQAEFSRVSWPTEDREQRDELVHLIHDLSDASQSSISGVAASRLEPSGAAKLPQSGRKRAADDAFLGLSQ